ncbi:MAG: prolyl aminopeptidase [bacterium]|nr:prolyl aminopeptidase [bacterium]
MNKKTLWFTLMLCAVFFLGFLSLSPAEDDLWPQTQPYKTGYFKVSEVHQLYYQLGGNPKGKPVMALHGGPGGSCTPHFFRYFNPEKFHVVLHDQRGAGKSKPYAELKDNTTPHLVEDVEKLRKHLKLGKVILFGGSWGSTLALAYAEKYPENVGGMVLRGIFTATRGEIDHFYHGGTATHFPDVYKKLQSVIPYPDKKNYPAQLLAKVKSTDKTVRDKYAKAWAMYEGKLVFLDIPDQRLEQILQYWSDNIYAFALIENYYMANNCFLKEEQLLNNAYKLKGIPLIMVNGRYDVICPPINAYRLQQKIPGAKVIFAESAGHSESEPSIQKQLILALKEFE